jgi:hypothetical protein
MQRVLLVPPHFRNRRRSSFTPATLTGVLVWLKADAGTFQDSALTTPATADAAPVGGWVDQSGSGNDLLQATAGLRPTLQTGELDTRPVIRFDGSDDFLEATFGAASAQPNHLFIVVKQLAADPGVSTVFDSSTANGQRLYAADADTYEMFAGGSGPTRDFGTTDFMLIEALFTGAGSTLIIDGGAAGTGNPGAGTLAGLCLGAAGGGGGGFSNQDVAEVLAVGDPVTGDNLTNLRSYFATRFPTLP